MQTRQNRRSHPFQLVVARSLWVIKLHLEVHLHIIATWEGNAEVGIHSSFTEEDRWQGGEEDIVSFIDPSFIQVEGNFGC